MGDKHKTFRLRPHRKSKTPGQGPQTQGGRNNKGPTREPKPRGERGGKAPTGAEPASQPKGRQRRQPKAAQGGANPEGGKQGQHQNKTETRTPKSDLTKWLVPQLSTGTYHSKILMFSYTPPRPGRREHGEKPPKNTNLTLPMDTRFWTPLLPRINTHSPPATIHSFSWCGLHRRKIFHSQP